LEQKSEPINILLAKIFIDSNLWIYFTLRHFLREEETSADRLAIASVGVVGGGGCVGDGDAVAVNLLRDHHSQDCTSVTAFPYPSPT